MNHPQYIPLKNRSVIEIKGEDKEKFLQGIITNDIKKVSNSLSIYSCLLTPQGKFLFDFFLCKIGDNYALDCALTYKDTLIKRLSMYKLRSDVTITDISDSYEVVALLGEKIFEETELDNIPGTTKNFCKGVAFIDPRKPEMFARAIIEKENKYKSFEAKGFSVGNPDDYEILRIKLGIPEGDSDLIQDKSFPLQFNMDSLGAIDFKKGCYVGQEVTTRSKHRGNVRKNIYVVESEGSIPEAGTSATIEGKQIGEIRSSVGNIGLALLEKERAKKAIENNSFIEARDTLLKLV